MIIWNGKSNIMKYNSNDFGIRTIYRSNSRKSFEKKFSIIFDLPFPKVKFGTFLSNENSKKFGRFFFRTIRGLPNFTLKRCLIINIEISITPFWCGLIFFFFCPGCVCLSGAISFIFFPKTFSFFWLPKINVPFVTAAFDM